MIFHRFLHTFTRGYCSPSPTSITTCRYAQGKRTRDEEDYLCQDCDVVLTVEPCIMCAMALVHSRVKRVAYRDSDLEFGGFGGKISLQQCQSLNHHPRVLVWQKREIVGPDPDQGVDDCGFVKASHICFYDVVVSMVVSNRST